jgi:hypothetical protein
LRGWLGPYTAEEWEQLAHGEEPIACHLSIEESGSWDGALQCRGAASYRANVAKSPRDPEVVVGPKDPNVFGFREFRTYHEEVDGSQA